MSRIAGLMMLFYLHFTNGGTEMWSAAPGVTPLESDRARAPAPAGSRVQAAGH